MDVQKQLKTAGTHNGKFHADEVMATAILEEIFDIRLTRTRDPEILGKLDIVYDVGGGEFDHHGIEKKYREDGTPYAACGLIWNRFGKDVISHEDKSLSEDEVNSVFDCIDRSLIEGIDAFDNGIKSKKDTIPMMNITSIINGFNPVWYSDENQDEAFNNAVNTISPVLKNSIIQKIAVIRSKDEVVKAYKNRKIPQVLILDRYLPWRNALFEIDENKEVLFVVFPGTDGYTIQTIREKGFEDRKKLPKSWAGKEKEELAAVTGVSDAIFCHSARFIAAARSFEGIMKMAELALNEPVERERKGLLSLIKRIFSKKNHYR